MTQKEALERLQENIGVLATDFYPIGSGIDRRISDEVVSDMLRECVNDMEIVRQYIEGQGWRPIESADRNSIFLAYDEHGESVGVWDRYHFTSLPELYSFDDEFSDNNLWEFLDCAGSVCGLLTHWKPILPPSGEE